MGKMKRQRQKFHISPNKEDIKKTESVSETKTPSFAIQPSDSNLFAGIDIDFGQLKNKLDLDDVQSIKSYKSYKSEGGKTLSKKEKLKLRREVLLHKIDTLNQMKKEQKMRAKRKNVAVIGDTNPLHDALPSLESLINRPSIQHKEQSSQPSSSKGIEKASKRIKKLIQNVNTFKTILNNKTFKQNPFEAITNHIQTIVANDKPKNRKN